jgi:hypothetical protein
MPVDDETKGVNRRLLLMSAWTVPVVASFALGGVASAGEKIWGGTMNSSVGAGAMARTPNGSLGSPAKTATPKPK